MVGAASAQNVAKIGSTEYATIEEAIAEWGPGKTLTLLADVQTSSTVTVEVNATKSTQNWTLDLGDYTWTANGCNAFQLYAAGGTVMNQNYGLKIYANQSGGITAAGKYCINCTYDVSTAGYRPRLEIHGGTYNGSYVVYYYASTSNNNNISNGPSTWFYKSNDGSEPVFNGKLGLFKCPINLYAGYFNDDTNITSGWSTIPAFNTYPVSSTANTNLNGGHFKSIGAFPSANNNKGIIFGNYKVFVKSDASIDVINGAPAEYEAKATKSLLLSSNQGVNYSDYVFYEKANDAIQKFSSGTIEIVLAPGVTATQDKSYRSGTLTIDASAEGSDYTGDITLTSTSAKFVVKFPEGGGHYGVTASTGTLHVEETVAGGVVTRTYSVISRVSNPEAKVDNTNYSTVYDAFYAVDGTTDNKTIVLQKDVTNAGIITNGTATGGDGKTVATFDLNGKSIGIGSVAAGNNADYTLTIIDSSQDKTGTVTNSDASLFILALTGISDYSGSYKLKVQAGTWQFDPSAVNVNGEIHNLVDEGYVAKDNGNGTWTVGEIPSVAKIGETKYRTIDAAVAAATEGQTVEVIMAGEYTLPGLPKNITVEGAVDGVVFNHTTAGNVAAIPNGATFKNVEFNFGNVNYHGFQHAGTINMEGCTLNGKLFSYGDMNFTDCSFNQSNSDYHMWTYSGNVTYTDCTFTNSVTGKFLNVYNESGATKYTVTVNNCKFVNNASANKAALNVKATSGSNLLAYDVIINNCTTEGAFPEASSSDALVVLNSLAQVDDRTASGVDNITVTQDGVLIYPATVAKIGDVAYPTLQSAVDAAQQIGGAVTVNIIDDISGETVTIKEVANFQLTIDGQKDASSNYTVDAVIIVDGLRGNGGSTTNGASVTLQNIAFVKTTATDGIQASHYPHHLTIQDCTYSGSDNDKWFLNASVDGPLYGVTIKDVTVEHARLIYANMADDAVFQNITATNDIKVGFNVKTSGTALIENCQVTTGKYAFRDYSDGYEGTFTLKDNIFISTSEESDEGVIVNRGGSDGTAHVNVESGTYTGHLKVLNNKECALAISGGYFSEEFPQEYIAANLVAQGKVCTPATDKEGYFTIGDPHFVAQIGETKYVSLQAALDAAHETTGDVTVELLDDIAGYSIVHQKDGLNLTIDGKEKTIAGQIIIDGDGRASGTETLLIQNIKFEGDLTNFYTGTDAFVLVPSTKDANTPYTTGKYNYAHNITISQCSFISTAEAFKAVAFKSNSGAGCYNLVMTNVSGDNLHSFAQLTGTTGATFDNCSATQTGSFIGVNGGGGTYTVSNCTFESHPDKTDGYAYREKSSSTAVATLTNNNFKAADAIILGSAGTINVESGTYVGEISKTAGTIVISGGHFSAPLADPDYAEFIAEGLCGVNGLYPDDTAAPNGIGTAVATVTNGTTVISYASLEAAFAAAVDGSTITLLKSTSGNGIVAPQGKFNTNGLTVDFGGFTYTVDGATVGSTGTKTQAFQLLKDNKITFQNGTIYSEKALMLVQNYSDLTLQGMTLDGSALVGSGRYTLSNNNGNVVIENSTITAKAGEGNYAFDVCRYADYPSVSVTVKGESVINGDVEVSASGSDAKDGFNLMFEAGTLNGKIVLDATAETAMAATPEKAKVSKSNALTAIAAPTDYKWVDNGDETSYLAPCVYVAQIGEGDAAVKYESLAAAVAAVPADGTETTITMIADDAVVAGVTIAASQNVVLELNGKTISGNTDSSKTYALITNKGTLVIQDNTDANLDGTGTGLITTYISNPDGGDVPGYASNTITNNGNLTVKSGKIVNNGAGYACFAIDNQTNGNLYNPTLIIDGGRMQQMNEYTYAVRMFANSTTNVNKCEVNGGVIEGGYGLWLQTPNANANKAVLKITGGIMNANDGAALYIGGTKADNSNISIDIAGGQVNGTGIIIQGPLSGTYGHVSIADGEFVNVQCGANVEKFISGGIFKNAVQEAYCAEGYIPTANTDPETKDAYPYTVKTGAYVAQIGEGDDAVKYESLAEAVAAAGASATIKMIGNETLTSNVVIGGTYGSTASQTTAINAQDITLDLNGYNITGDKTIYLAGGSLNITGEGTIENTGTGASPVGVRYVNSTSGLDYTSKRTLTIGENVSLKGKVYGLNIFGTNSATVANDIEVNVNGKVEGMLFVLGNLKNDDNNIVINVNGSVDASGIELGYEECKTGIALNGNAKLVVNDGASVKGETGIEVRAGELTVNGGTITATASEYSYTANNSGTTIKGAAIAVASYDADKDLKVTVSDGTLSGAKLIAVVDVQNDMEKVTVTAKDEFVDGADEILIPQDYKWASNGDGTSTLKPCVYVAQIGEGDAAVKYESLADAVAAVPADGTETTITMIANDAIDVVGYAVTIPTTKNVVLDLNGFQVVGTASEGNTSALITNKGTLTIKDSSDTNADGTGTGKLASGATSTWTWDGTDDYSGSYASNLIRNEGTLVVESGNLYNMSTGSASYAIDNYSAGKVTINGGKIDAAKASAIRLFYNNGGSVTVNGGVIGRYVSDDDCTYMGIQVQNGTNANVTITGGTIDGYYAVYANNTGGKISISGGTLNSYVMFGSAGPSDISISGGAHYYVYAYGSQTKFVSGGIYAYEVDETYIADGYILTDNTDPATKDDYPYTVRAGMYIAAIGTTKYETLQEAVDAAGTSATTITLLTEAATEGVISGDGVVVPSGSNITFDLNGLTYDVAGETVGSSGTETLGFQLLQNSDITIKNGTLKATAPTAQMLIQNYSNLTLEDVNLDGTGLSGWAYALSNNCGTINLTGSTSITAKTGGRAFDTCKFGSYAIPTVNINTTGAITGPIEATGGKLNIENGKFNVTWVTDNNYSAGDIQIKGGIFSEEPAEEYLVEGYITTDNEDEDTKAAYPYAVMTKEDAGIYDLYDLLASNTTHVPQKTIYTLEEDTPVKVVTYYREFSNTTANTRQCWMVPFDYTLTAEDLEKCTFYRVHMFSAPANQEGVVEDENEVVMKISELTAGYTLKANKPYIIKPKAAGVYEFVAENTTLKAKNTESLLTLSTSINDYDFYGVYDSYGPMAANQWFSLNTNGMLKWNAANQKLGPYRWYIKPTFTGDDYANIAFVIDEEAEGDETTTIDRLIYDPNAEIEGFYTVGGVKLDKPVRGLNIVKYTDGRTKKVYVK